MSARNESDEEVEEFMVAEQQAAKQKKKNKKTKKKEADEEEQKLFMQLGWAEQRRIGTNAPVVRQVEGDSVNHRVKIYRRTIFFHIHAKLNHKAYAIHALQLNNQDPNGKDERGRTALHYACRYGAEDTVRTLLHEEVTIDDPDLEMRWTPLHFAVMGGHQKVVELLLDKAPVRRVTINRKDKYGTTPLMLACGEDNAKIAKLLLQKKAFIDETDDDGWSALHYAAINDAATAGEVLIRYDANLVQRTNSTNETPLEMAERIRSHLIAILLYEVMNQDK